MVWIIIAVCLLLALLIADMCMAWSLFNKMFGRGKLPVNPGAGDPEAEAEMERARQVLKETNDWISSRGPEAISIKSDDGTELSGWLLIADKPTDSFVIGVHGYKSSRMSDIALMSRFYIGECKNVLLVDDRAHGESGGKYIGFGWLDRLDVLCWCRYIVERFGKNARIMLHGVSMGAATVCCAAGEESLPEQVKGVVSDCGYSNAWKEVSYVAHKLMHLPMFPTAYIGNIYLRVLAHYDLRDCRVSEQVKKAKVPFLFIHGGDDKFVPTPMVHELYGACRTKKELLIVPGASHAMSWSKGEPEYREHLLRFMDEIKL